MVLHLKVWESKSLPGLLASQYFTLKHDAGWSSPVARQAHNLKVVGSNPTPATNLFNKINNLYDPQRLRFLGFFCCNFKCLCQPLCQPVVRFFYFSLTLILNIIFYSTSTGLFQNCTIIVPLF